MSVVYEVLCLALTLYKTFGTYRHGRAARLHTPLSSLILRDGEHHIFAKSTDNQIHRLVGYDRVIVLCVRPFNVHQLNVTIER